MNIWKDMQDRLDSLQGADLLRNPAVLDSACGPRVTLGGRDVLCLCSNDYLSLASDAAVKRAAAAAIERWGVGAGASRLVSGSLAPHVELERALAAFKGVEAALVTSTGWQANAVAIHALAGAGDLVLCDKLNHASILDAAMACGGRVRTYAHRDMPRLRGLLEKHRADYQRCLIVTDSVFSMDGDVAPLREIAAVKSEYDCQLLIDEAHATGVLGEHGRGAAQLLGVEDEIDAVVGTLSKALGSLGGFVCGRRVLIETIRNRGRAFIYTTALPPALCAAAMEALAIIAAQPQRRQRVLQLAADLRAQLAAAGFNLGDRDNADDAAAIVTPILPVILGPAGKAMAVSRRLLEEGFLVPAIRPPTVPPNTSRLRVSLCCNHEPADLRRFVTTVKQIVSSPN